MAIAETVLLGVVAFFHVWFFVLERFIWNMPLGQKIFRMSAEKAEAGALLAANQGVYNLFLAVGILWSMFAKDSAQATPVKISFLLYIIAVGVYGGITVGKNVFFMQVIPAVLALLAVIATAAKPRINDITTSFVQPPQFQSNVAAGDVSSSYTPEFAVDQKAYYEGVLPLVLNMPPQAVYDLVGRALATFPEWEITNRDVGRFAIEGQVTTQFMRFTDDFVIEVRPTATGSEVHMRSRSRVGKSDFGVNARRIVTFLNRVHALSLANS
jgi:putative membrane protein